VSFACRIDTLRRLPTGEVELEYTAGSSPLPAERSGEGLRWNSLQQAAEDVQRVQDLFTRDHLPYLLLAIWRQANPSGNNPAAIVGRMITVNVTAATITLTVT
jgi:hypothetical protein